jgi:hypothetical protein
VGKKEGKGGGMSCSGVEGEEGGEGGARETGDSSVRGCSSVSVGVLDGERRAGGRGEEEEDGGLSRSGGEGGVGRWEGEVRRLWLLVQEK